MRVVLMLSMAFAASSAMAEEKLAMRGAGAISCGKYLDSQKSPQLKLLNISWAQGFLSGMNLADISNGKQMIFLPDAETINLYLVNHCTKNPLENPAFGAIYLYKELRERESRPSSSLSSTPEKPKPY